MASPAIAVAAGLVSELLTSPQYFNSHVLLYYTWYVFFTSTMSVYGNIDR